MYRELFVSIASLMAFQSSLFAETPPQAPQHPHKITQNSVTRNDPFFWLRDHKNPATLKYLQDENRYTESVMKTQAGLERKLYQEMRSRIQEADSSVPYQVDQYDYYTRTEEGKEYAIYCRKARTSSSAADPPEEIILDGNKMAEGQKYFQLGTLDVSRDQHLLQCFGIVPASEDCGDSATSQQPDHNLSLHPKVKPTRVVDDMTGFPETYTRCARLRLVVAVSGVQAVEEETPFDHQISASRSSPM